MICIFALKVYIPVPHIFQISLPRVAGKAGLVISDDCTQQNPPWTGCCNTQRAEASTTPWASHPLAPAQESKRVYVHTHTIHTDAQMGVTEYQHWISTDTLQKSRQSSETQLTSYKP